MRRPGSAIRGCLAALGAIGVALAAELPSDWRSFQDVEVSAAGLARLQIPMATLDAAHPSFRDLRLVGATGRDVPFALRQPRKKEGEVRGAERFEVSLEAERTVILVTPGDGGEIEEVLLETPASEFIKAVTIEGTRARDGWDRLVEARPVFRQAHGASSLGIPVPKGVWRRLRVVLDDRRSVPIPITGVRVRQAGVEDLPTETLECAIVERSELPQETRWILRLPARNLFLPEIVVATDEPLFTRSIQLARRATVDGEVKETPVASGTVFRVALDGRPPAESLVLPVFQQVAGREVVLTVKNGDSPPLRIERVLAHWGPVDAIFLSTAPGRFRLLVGNAAAEAPRYDLLALEGRIGDARFVAATAGPLIPNPAFRTREALPEIAVLAGPIDLEGWSYRKPLTFRGPGIHRVELDPESLAHSEASGADLRIVKDGRQIPFVVDRNGGSRSLVPVAEPLETKEGPRLSRFALRLPQRNLPLTRLTCTAAEGVFQRDVVVYEEVEDDRGSRHRINLGRVQWVRAPGQDKRELSIPLDARTRSDTLFLEIANRDNPPLTLGSFSVDYRAPRLILKAPPEGPVWLAYGNPKARPPAYDIDLVADQLLEAEKLDAVLGPEEALTAGSWRKVRLPAGAMQVVFWGSLTLAVAVLLFVIRRLLPPGGVP